MHCLGVGRQAGRQGRRKHEWSDTTGLGGGGNRCLTAVCLSCGLLHCNSVNTDSKSTRRRIEMSSGSTPALFHTV